MKVTSRKKRVCLPAVTLGDFSLDFKLLEAAVTILLASGRFIPPLTGDTKQGTSVSDFSQDGQVYLKGLMEMNWE